MMLTSGFGGALGGTRTPNLLIRSQMLYPLSYERSHCSILHPEPSRRVLETCGRAYSGVKAPGFLIRKPDRESGDLLDSVRCLFRLDPADQVVPADRIQQGWMVAGHVAPDHPHHLVVAVAAGHEPAFASDQLHHRISYSGCLPQRNARMLA